MSKKFFFEINKLLKDNNINSFKTAYGLPSQVYQTNIFNRHYIDSAIVQTCSSFIFPKSDEFLEFREEITRVFKKNAKNPSFYEKKMKGKETLTEDKIIKPILEALGWPDENITTRAKIPFTDPVSEKKSSKEIDLVLFRNEETADYFNDQNDSKKTDRDHFYNELKKEAQVILEAKTIGSLTKTANESARVKDSKKPGEDTPNAQTYFYMKKLGHKYAILSDGRYWRLIFNDELREEYDREQNPFFQIDISQLFQFYRINQSEGDDRSKCVYELSLALFYNFFSKESVEKFDTKSKTVLNHLVSHRNTFFKNLDEKIGPRFVLAMSHLANGFSEEITHKGENPEDYSDIIRKTSESFLFSLMFFRNLEMKNILPYFDSSENYKEKFSISYIIEDILYKNNKTFSKNGADSISDLFTESGMNLKGTDGRFLYKRITSAMKHVMKGKSKSFKNFDQTIFTPEEKSFNKKFSPKDRYFLNAIYFLFFIPLEKETANDSLQLIPYESMTPREIGTLYESFLEFELSQVDGSSVYWNMKSQKWIPFKKGCLSSSDSEKLKFRTKSLIFKHRKDNERKKTGSYYTPDYIVKNIVKTTLDPLVRGVAPEKLLKIKICDLAMGSGHFLSEALDYITAKYYEFEHEENITYQEAARRVLSNCIYGVDLNQSAVKLAKMTLWMKTACSSFSLENLCDQIKSGDSLLEFDWEKEFINSLPNNGFDAVVGNPPYIRVQNLEHSYIDSLKENYQMAYKRVDSSILFIELGLEIISKKGRMGIITSNQFIANEYGRKARGIMSETKCIESIVDFGDLPVFKNALTYVSIFHFSSDSKRKTIKYQKVSSLKENGFTLGSDCQLDYTELSDDTWTLEGKEEREIISRFQNTKTLESIGLEVKTGMFTGFDQAYLFKNIDDIPRKIQDEGLLMNMLQSKDCERYSIAKPTRKVIYPYKLDGEKNKVLTLTELKKHKATYSHLIDHEDKIKARKDSRKTFKDRDDWYALVRSGKLADISHRKIVTPGECKINKFCIAEAGVMYPCARIFGLYLKDEKRSLNALLGLLNSRLVQYFLHKTAPLKQGGYYSYSNGVLSAIPVPENYQKIEKKLDKLVNSVISGKKEKELEIDELIYKAFNLSQREIDIIEDYSSSIIGISIKDEKLAA